MSTVIFSHPCVSCKLQCVARGRHVLDFARLIKRGNVEDVAQWVGRKEARTNMSGTRGGHKECRPDPAGVLRTLDEGE